MGKQLVIKIRANGTVESETKGIYSKECMDYMELIASLADARIVDSEFTKDFYINDVVSQESQSEEAELSRAKFDEKQV